MLDPIGLDLDGKQGHTPATLTISSGQAKITVASSLALAGPRKSATATETVYGDLNPTDGKIGFFVGTTFLTVDTALTKGASSGKATIESDNNDDGEPVDPEDGTAHKPGTIRSITNMACTKK
jgi:hypothetical protein